VNRCIVTPIHDSKRNDLTCRQFSPLLKLAPVLFHGAMEKQPATNSSRSLFVRLWPWLVVLGILLFVGFIRVRLLEMPLERDEG